MPHPAVRCSVVVDGVRGRKHWPASYRWHTSRWIVGSAGRLVDQDRIGMNLDGQRQSLGLTGSQARRQFLDSRTIGRRLDSNKRKPSHQ